MNLGALEVGKPAVQAADDMYLGTSGSMGWGSFGTQDGREYFRNVGYPQTRNDGMAA